MRPDAALADANREVRLAAREWRAAGLVDATVVDQVDARFPDDRARVGTVLRILLFVFTVIAANAAVGLFGLLARSWLLALAFGLALAWLTEWQVTTLRRSGGGTEEATSLLALVWTTAGLVWALHEVADVRDASLVVLAGLVTAALAVAFAWRWGMPAYGAIAVGALFVAATQIPGSSRLVWIVGSAIAIPLLDRWGRSASLPPSRRGGIVWAITAAAVLLYVAANAWSVDSRWLEELELTPSHHALLAFPVWVAAILTAALPVSALAWGVRCRDRLALWLGGAMLAASAVTLRHFVAIAPLWVILVAAGALVLATAVLLQRWLRSGHEQERGDFTARPLFEGRLESAAEVVATLASLTPEARPVPAESAPDAGGFKPGGGEFGGGGASGDF